MTSPTRVCCNYKEVFIHNGAMKAMLDLFLKGSQWIQITSARFPTFFIAKTPLQTVLCASMYVFMGIHKVSLHHW